MTTEFSTARSTIGRATCIGLLALTGWMILSAFVATNDASAAGWRCRASVARIEIRDLGPLEPIVANQAPNNGCIHDFAGVKDIQAGSDGINFGGSNAVGGLIVEGPSAETFIDPFGEGVAPGLQTARSVTRAANVRLEDAKGFVSIGVNAVSSQQSIHCVNGQIEPFNGSSQVAGLTLNGQQITPDGFLKIVGDGLNGLPTNEILKVHFNEVTEETLNDVQHFVTRRAIHIELLKVGNQAPLLDIVVGEARVGWVGRVCTAEPPPPPIRWTCRASVARLSGTGFLDVEPVVANKPPGNNCRNARAGLNDLNLGGDPIGGLHVSALQAFTGVFPPRGVPASAQVAGALTRLANVVLTSPDGETVLTADSIISQSKAICSAGVPTFTGSSTVLNLTLNGQPISPDETFEQVGDGINGTPLGQLVRISFNLQSSEGNPTTTFEKHTQTAVLVEIVNFVTGGNLAELALGETQVGRKRAVCDT